MRKLNGFEINKANKSLSVTVIDDPGPSGASNRFDIEGFNTKNNPSAEHPEWGKAVFSRSVLVFQNGPIRETGVNGITHEVLIEIILDRLKGFQTTKYVCRENEMAIKALEEAKNWLNARTQKRMDQGIEGTHSV